MDNSQNHTAVRQKIRILSSAWPVLLDNRQYLEREKQGYIEGFSYICHLYDNDGIERVRRRLEDNRGFIERKYTNSARRGTYDAIEVVERVERLK